MSLSGVAGIARDNGGYAGIFAARCAAGENAGKHGCRAVVLGSETRADLGVFSMSDAEDSTGIHH